MYLFDQLSGNTQSRDNGLILSNMNVSYRCADYSMHDTILLEVGSYPALLSVGSYQHMNLRDSDQGPFWMDAREQLSSKYDVLTNGSTVK